MQKKEIILLAALLNGVILSFLFATAIHESMPTVKAAPVAALTAGSAKPLPVVSSPFVNRAETEVITLDPWPQDEVDHALQPYLSGQSTRESASDMATSSTTESVNSSQTTTGQPEDYREAVVKRGDALDKIARQHGVSVKEIKKINQLTSDRLSVGQVLILPKPVVGNSEVAAQTRAPVEKAAPAPTQEVQSYTMKAGDNPWKIARSHKMKLEDLLQLNGWTEESARNLQTGDVIRVYATPATH